MGGSASSNPRDSFGARDSFDPANPASSSDQQAALEAALGAERERVAALEETLEVTAHPWP